MQCHGDTQCHGAHRISPYILFLSLAHLWQTEVGSKRLPITIREQQSLGGGGKCLKEGVVHYSVDRGEFAATLDDFEGQETTEVGRDTLQLGAAED